jgi:hypothetical protein
LPPAFLASGTRVRFGQQCWCRPATSPRLLGQRPQPPCHASPSPTRTTILTPSTPSVASCPHSPIRVSHHASLTLPRTLLSHSIKIIPPPPSPTPALFRFNFNSALAWRSLVRLAHKCNFGVFSSRSTVEPSSGFDHSALLTQPLSHFWLRAQSHNRSLRRCRQARRAGGAGTHSPPADWASGECVPRHAPFRALVEEHHRHWSIYCATPRFGVSSLRH